MLNKLKLLLITISFGGFGLISFIPGIIGIDSRLITISYRFLIFTISGIILLDKLYKKNLKINFTSSAFLSFIMMIFYVFRLINDTEFNFGRSHFEIIILTLCVGFLPAIAFANLKVDDNYKISRDFLINCFGLLSFISLLNGFLNGFQYGRLAGNEVLNPTALGYYSASGIILIFSKIITSKEKISLNFNSCKLAIFLFLNLIVLLLSASRGPFLGLVLVLSIQVFPKFSVLRKNIFPILIGILTLLALLLRFDIITSMFLGRFTNIDFGEGNLLDGELRFILWNYAFQYFLNNPILGIHTTTDIGYPHNIFIEILMSTGLVGGVIFAIIYFRTLKKILLLSKLNSPFIWPGLLFILHSIVGFFAGSIYSSRYLWWSLGILISLNIADIKVDKK